MSYAFRSSTLCVQTIVILVNWPTSAAVIIIFRRSDGATRYAFYGFRFFFFLLPGRLLLDGGDIDDRIKRTTGARYYYFRSTILRITRSPRNKQSRPISSEPCPSNYNRFRGDDSLTCNLYTTKVGSRDHRGGDNSVTTGTDDRGGVEATRTDFSPSFDEGSFGVKKNPERYYRRRRVYGTA